MSSVHIVPPCRSAVEILYKDEHLLVVNKPSGLLSVPGRHPDNQDCVIGRMQQDHPAACVVHRLDLDTSGLMVIALDKDSQRALSRLFQQRAVEKRYTAVVDGLVAPDAGSIDLPLICDWPNRPRQKVDLEQGKPALTHFRVLERDVKKNQSRLELSPVTGRSHQLRLHTAARGHPILGCCFYAPAAVHKASTRLLLHASAISFEHPFRQTQLALTHPAPF